MFAVGHFALAYLLGKASGKILKVQPIIPLMLVLSIIPDIDILSEPFIAEVHRGPTHSLIMTIIAFLPLFMLCKQKAAPYFTAFVSHALLGDFLIGGQIQIFWPLSTRKFGLTYIDINSPINIASEFILFIITLTVLIKTRDLAQFLQNSKLNLVLAIPLFTVLLPTFTSYPLSVPALLIPPHLFYLLLFSVSVSIVATNILKQTKTQIT
ncbi:MAG: metal-dependent hydrolase [Candidatus Bathyarchaeota archaeon]|nr:metal-dependent hydrolase [Candidatus Bathyarchaeota archaeon]